MEFNSMYEYLNVKPYKLIRRCKYAKLFYFAACIKCAAKFMWQAGKTVNEKVKLPRLRGF